MRTEEAYLQVQQDYGAWVKALTVGSEVAVQNGFQTTICTITKIVDNEATIAQKDKPANMHYFYCDSGKLKNRFDRISPVTAAVRLKFTEAKWKQWLKNDAIAELSALQPHQLEEVYIFVRQLQGANSEAIRGNPGTVP